MAVLAAQDPRVLARDRLLVDPDVRRAPATDDQVRTEEWINLSCGGTADDDDGRAREDLGVLGNVKLTGACRYDGL